MASPKLKQRYSKRKKNDEKSDLNSKMPALKLADVMCPVCLCILIEPVTMPCSHNLCMPCFHQNVQETSLLCPICRKRISSWSRKATRNNSLINTTLWKAIQDEFPGKVQRRQSGDESDTDDDIIDDEELKGPPVKLCKPGEIRQEYELQLKRLEEEKEKEREREYLQSSKLIKKLQEEEERLKELSENDHVIALMITKQINEAPAIEDFEVNNSILSNIHEVPSPAITCTPARRRPISLDSSCPSSGIAIPSQKYIIPINEKSTFTGKNDEKCKGDCSKTALSDEPVTKYTGKLSRSNSLDSDDSITPELRHFRPIKTAPKTPPLRLPNGQIKETPLIHATPRALVFDIFCCEPDNNDLVRKRLADIEEDRRKCFNNDIGVNRAEIRPAKRKHNLLRTLAPFGTSPGNCFLDPKPEQNYALSDLVANKENPKSTDRKRKLIDNGTRTETTKKRKGLLGPGDVNVRGNSKLQPSRHTPKSQTRKSPHSKLPPSKTQTQVKKPKLSVRKMQEESDRLVALALHRELNCKRTSTSVDRRIGTQGEYYLRSRDSEVTFRQQTTSSL